MWIYYGVFETESLLVVEMVTTMVEKSAYKKVHLKAEKMVETLLYSEDVESESLLVLEWEVWMVVVKALRMADLLAFAKVGMLDDKMDIDCKKMVEPKTSKVS